MTKVKLDTIKPWITSKITELLGGMEDDVVVEYVFNQLEQDKVMILLFSIEFAFVEFLLFFINYHLVLLLASLAFGKTDDHG